jgi:drug/metabolite transporter (DMT)-like permease
MAGAIYSDHPIPILPVGLARARIRRRSAASLILATRRWLAYAALVVAVLGITWSAVFVRRAAVSGPASAFYRVFIAAIVLIPRRATRRDLPWPSRGLLWLAVAGGAFFGFDLLFFNTAVLRTSGATAVLLGNNAPVFVGLGTWLFFRKRPPKTFWYGLGLALTGCAGIVAADTFSHETDIGDVTGDLLALTAAVFFAGYLMTTERVRSHVDSRKCL